MERQTPILIEFNEAKFNREISSLNYSRSKIQELIFLYQRLGLIPLAENELPQLLLQTEELIFNKTVQTHPEKFNGYDHRKMFEMLSQPQEYHQLLSGIKTFISVREKYAQHHHDTVTRYLEQFILTDTGEVIIDDNRLDEIKRKYEVVISSSMAKTAYEFASVVINELKKAKQNKLPINEQLQLKDFIDRAFIWSANGPDLNAKYIKQFDYPGRVGSPFVSRPAVAGAFEDGGVQMISLNDD